VPSPVVPTDRRFGIGDEWEVDLAVIADEANILLDPTTTLATVKAKVPLAYDAPFVIVVRSGALGPDCTGQAKYHTTG
jgi:hypothetical protein